MDPPPALILLIDDDPAFCTMVQRQLERAGYQVECAADGRVGLARLEAGGVDLVLLDVMMPGIDGRQVCQRVRAREGASYMPIIMLTGLGGDAARRAGFAAGADDYLTKPFLREELLDRIAVWLRARQHMPAGEPDAAGPALTAPPGGAGGTRALEEAVLRQEGRLHALVHEASRAPEFLAALLVPYARAQGWDESELAAELGCPLATLVRLLLRRRPGPMTWEADVAIAAQACGADPSALARVLRAATTWERTHR
jgi:DNA-binding response OmpR family regulator